MNARVIIGEQHIGFGATDEDRDTFGWALAEAMEKEFPGLSVDYNPLSGASYEWQEIDGVDREAVEEWVAQNWESILADTFTNA